MSQLGRLPPLQTIGRSTRVDLEDPPDFSDTEIDAFLDAYSTGKEQSYVYSDDHPESAATGLAGHFRLLNPGNHVCRRIPEVASGFTHSRHSVPFAVKYAELRHMLQTRAQLNFVQNYVSRINATTMYVKDLEAVVHEEYSVWYKISHDCLDSVPVTKLECLSSICEDLRVHMSHWGSIKHLLHTDPWLKPQAHTLVLQLDEIRACLTRLQNTALWWIDRLIQVGFRVLAHCDLERITTDSLWGITRGLEEFNQIVTSVKSQSALTNHVLSLDPQHGNVQFNSFKNIIDSIKPIPFSRVLSLLASERSQFAAASTHQFFTRHKELQQLTLSSKAFGVYDWKESLVGVRKGGNTSDYHTASGSHVSLGTAMLTVGSVRAPDLSDEDLSSLIDFARREKTFAHKFLQIVCNSTKLLKRQLGAANNSQAARRSAVLAKPGNHSNQTAATSTATTKKSLRKSEPAVSENLLSVAPSRSDVKRKSVTWGDSSEIVVIQQLIQRYMEMLWQHFSSSLTDRFIQPIWGGTEEVKGQLGSLIVCSDLVVQVVLRMIRHTSS